MEEEGEVERGKELNEKGDEGKGRKRKDKG